MEAFVVFTREETTDPQELATYSAGVGPSFEGHDVTFLAAYGAMDHLEVIRLNSGGCSSHCRAMLSAVNLAVI